MTIRRSAGRRLSSGNVCAALEWSSKRWESLPWQRRIPHAERAIPLATRKAGHVSRSASFESAVRNAGSCRSTPGTRRLRSVLRKYTVVRREAVVERIEDALVASGASIVTHANPRSAPFEITIRTPTGETLDLVCYAFTANGYRRAVRPDRHHFRITYRGGADRCHQLYFDPMGKGPHCCLACTLRWICSSALTRGCTVRRGSHGRSS